MARTISTVSSTSGPFTYASYVIESMNDNKQIRIVVNNQEKVVTINKADKNNVALLKSLKTAYDNNKRDVVLGLIKNKTSVLVATDKSSFKLSDIIKPVKETPELGYIGEAIIQAGMFARFCNKDKDITRKDIEIRLNEFINHYMKGNTSTPLISLSPNFQHKGSAKIPDDIVECYYELAIKYVQWLAKAGGKYNVAPYTALDSFFRDAVTFANSSTVTSQSKEIYYNGRQDKILIEGTGVSGQNITKADIKVYKFVGYEKGKSNGTKTEINLRVSAKIKDITQFGQVSGLTWDKQTYLFDQLLSVNIDGVKNKYNKLVKEPSMLIDNTQIRLDAYSLIYEEAVRQFNTSSNKVKKLVDGIKQFMTLNEDETGGVHLVVVSIGGAGLSITDTSKLSVDNVKKYLKENKLAEKDITAVFYQTGAGRQINIMIGKEQLLNLSGRWTANRCANYVSGGPVLYKILKNQ